MRVVDESIKFLLRRKRIEKVKKRIETIPSPDMLTKKERILWELYHQWLRSRTVSMHQCNAWISADRFLDLHLKEYSQRISEYKKKMGFQIESEKEPGRWHTFRYRLTDW